MCHDVHARAVGARSGWPAADVAPHQNLLTAHICSLYSFSCDLNLSFPYARPKGDAGEEAEDWPTEVSQGDSASPSEQCTSDVLLNEVNQISPRSTSALRKESKGARVAHFSERGSLNSNG